MKYVLGLLNHIMGKLLWLMVVFATLFTMLFFFVFGFLWDFKNHIGESEILLFKNPIIEFKEYTLINILGKISEKTKQ